MSSGIFLDIEPRKAYGKDVMAEDIAAGIWLFFSQLVFVGMALYFGGLILWNIFSAICTIVEFVTTLPEKLRSLKYRQWTIKKFFEYINPL